MTKLAKFPNSLWAMRNHISKIPRKMLPSDNVAGSGAALISVASPPMMVNGIVTVIPWIIDEVNLFVLIYMENLLRGSPNTFIIFSTIDIL
ncbi:hypothetical protein D3Z45_05415 [Lachnospiraceae bacterium]|nr:hypothetical protein [Lachnospiraceae bacterium]